MSLTKKSKLKALVNTIEEIPQISNYMRELKNKISDPKSFLSEQEFKTFFDSNQQESEKVLRLIYSDFFSLGDETISVYEAFCYIGKQDFYNMSLLVELNSLLKYRQTLKDDFDKEGFWIHSVGCAFACREIADHMGLPALDKAFMAGMLHGIGKIVFRKYFNPYLQKIISLVRQNDILMIEAEKEFFEFTHCDIGVWFLEAIEVELFGNFSILHYYEPEKYLDKDSLVPIVHMGDILVRALCIGDPGDEKIPEMNPAAFEFCQLTLGYLEFILDQIALKIPKIKSCAALF